MLEISDLSKIYKGEASPALDRVSLTIHPGEMVAVLGRSGAGKSTLVRCINRLAEPNSGRITWNGRPITGVSEKELRKLRGRIGMIFQHYHLLPRLNVLTNVLSGRFAAVPLWRSLLGNFSAQDKQDAMDALSRVGLEHTAHKRVEELSGGQKQRVAIARVLMQRPELLLGDEPVSSLDPVTADKVLSFLQKLHLEEKMTIVLNLHDVGLAKRYAERIIGLAHGRIVFDGQPEQLTDEMLRVIYPDDDPKEKAVE